MLANPGNPTSTWIVQTTQGGIAILIVEFRKDIKADTSSIVEGLNVRYKLAAIAQHREAVPSTDPGRWWPDWPANTAKTAKQKPYSDPGRWWPDWPANTAKTAKRCPPPTLVGGGQTGQLTRQKLRSKSPTPTLVGVGYDSPPTPSEPPPCHKAQSTQHKSYPSKASIPREPQPLDSYTTKQSRQPIDHTQPPR